MFGEDASKTTKFFGNGSGKNVRKRGCAQKERKAGM